MPTSSSAAPSPGRNPRLAAWLPPPRAMLWIGGAFAFGLLLFLFVWKNSSDKDFYRAGPAAPTAAVPRYTPLPAPVPGENAEVSDVAPPSPAAGEDEDRPRLVETAPPPLSQVATAPAPRAVAPDVATSLPQPISSPAPRYPARALRRREQGTVLVSADIGVDGVPDSVEVARSSGSRSLDRAAVDAVRRWRFRPALADGRPVPGHVQVPINFQAE